MIFLKCLELWVSVRFGDMWRPDVQFCESGGLPLSPPLHPPPHFPPPNPYLSSGNGVARLPGRNSGQKAQKGPQKKISGRILADFTKNRQKRGRRKFVYCILKIKFITVITAKNKEHLLNIFCGPFSACFW